MACAAAVVYAAAFLFGPTYTTRSSGAIGPDQPSRRSARRALDDRAVHRVLGVALRACGHLLGVGLVVAGFAIDATSIIGMGGGFVFALLCGPLLLVALIATLALRVRQLASVGDTPLEACPPGALVELAG